MESTYYDNEQQRILVISVPTRTTLKQVKEIVEAFKPKSTIGEPVIATDCMVNLNGELIDLNVGKIRGEKLIAIRWDKGND
jgi:hypothetical protein